MNSRNYFLACLIIIGAFLMLFFLAFIRPPLTGFAVFETLSQSQFDEGIYVNTAYNGSALVLIGANLAGSYTSRVFNAGQTAKWNNFSWVSGGTGAAVLLRSCDDSLCFGDEWNQIIWTSGSSLIVQNQTYLQYKVIFARSTETEESAVYSTSIDYTLHNELPAVFIEHPQHGAAYNYNDSLPFNFMVRDDNLASCWYTLNNGATNTTLAGCSNTTLSLAFGNYALALYANDTNGSLSSYQSNFTLSADAPLLYLFSPSQNFATNASSAQFYYYVNDSNLQECGLLSDFSGAWGTSATNNTQQSGLNSFDVEFDESGSRLWGVECFDATFIQSASSNRTIVIDSSAPSVSLTSPTGTYSSKQNIPIGLTVTDGSSTTCIYSLTKVGAGTVLVVVMPQCADTSFNVAESGNYQLTVTVTDSAGNAGVSSSEFSVSEGDSGSGAGSSGSGNNGVSVNIQDLVIPKLEHDALPEIRLRAGFTGNYTLELVNKGNKFLNNCTLAGIGSAGFWFTSSDFRSLNPGERASYAFSLSVPRDALPGKTIVDVSASCAEIEQDISLVLTVIPAEFVFDIARYERAGTSFVLNYTLEDLTGQGTSVLLHYALVNAQDIIVTEGTETISAKPNARELKTLVFALPKDAVGEFELRLELATASDRIEVIHPVFLSGSSVSGLAVSEGNKKTLTIWGMVAVACAVVFFTLRFLLKRRRLSSSQA